ncbi:MAG: bifunctional diguanylate cyclase/phosphodiesterase [Chloracidobacterium sp.]|nr:bifunctional diguanylate cyclase/phosphodiesterase [Chloracidobacterium sp.]
MSNVLKAVVIAIAATCFIYAIFRLPEGTLGLGFLLVLLFGSFVSPKLSLTLPRSKFAISFSDALIFLTFLLYGGEGAIILAALETFASCIYLRSSGFRIEKLMIPVNVAVNVITAAATYLFLQLFLSYAGETFHISKSQHLITLLGSLAFSQFLISSLFAAVFRSLDDGKSFWQTWKKDCFPSSMTQIVGAGLAGIVFKVINYGDFVTAAIALTAIAVAFLNYRQSITDINRAFGQVEDAERAKAETERERRREAERHADELRLALDKAEQANTALRKSEQDLQHAALHDSLTGLANRKKLGDVLRSLIAENKADPSTVFQVLFVDIRGFKNINDSLGHTIGDKVLVIAAKRFIRMLNPGDVVARIGGDEFAIILRDLKTVEKAFKVASRIHASLTQPFSLGGHTITIGLNIGIASCDPEYDTPEEILRDADIAMHFAKEKDDGPAIFTKDMRSKFLERIHLENDLRHAIDRGELLMHYQPIVSLTDGRLVGFEALLRWHHSTLGNIPPNRFISIAEDSGLILPITVWILHQTCRQLAEWQKIGSEYSGLIVSVNISGKHLSKDFLIDDVLGALNDSGVAPQTLKLEITESTAMENAEHSIAILKRLKEIGVQLSIDDFGTGYSSLSHLHRLPFDTLKIDRSFVNRVGEKGEDAEVLQTIISLAKNLKMRVIAEGIETTSQLAVLQNLGCDYGQGYLLAKPKGVEEIEEQLYKRTEWLPAEAIDTGGEYGESVGPREGLSLH